MKVNTLKYCVVSGVVSGLLLIVFSWSIQARVTQLSNYSKVNSIQQKLMSEEEILTLTARNLSTVSSFDDDLTTVVSTNPGVRF